jgi:hypothetical protein
MAIGSRQSALGEIALWYTVTHFFSYFVVSKKMYISSEHVNVATCLLSQQTTEKELPDLILNFIKIFWVIEIKSFFFGREFGREFLL